MHTKTKSCIDIQVGFNMSFKWYNHFGIWFIGYLFDEKDKYITGNAAIQVFEKCEDFEKFKEIISSLNGIYSVIINHDEKVFAASDFSRFFPLFYSQKANKFSITDNFYRLIHEQSTVSFNNDGLTEFLTSAVTNQSRTLIDNVFQVRAGEVICYENLRVKKEYFTSILTKKSEYQGAKYKELIESGYASLEKIREKFISSLDKKQVLLPLNSGFDSRLIAAWLKLSGINNVVCFTYASKINSDIEVSKRIAEILGYEYHFIEYNEQLIENYKDGKEFDLFFRYISKGVSAFQMQDFFAIRELINRKVINKEFIVIPEHAGGIIAGSYLKDNIPLKISRANIFSQLLKRNYFFSPMSSEQQEKVGKNLNAHLSELEKLKTEYLPYSLMEDWTMREGITKSLINSAHVFTYFGLEVRLPLFNNEFFEFWRTVPAKYRKNKKLYDKILSEKYFEPLDLNFKNEHQATPKDITIYHLKKKIRPHLSLKAKHKLLKKNDWVFYDEITTPFLEDLKEKDIRYKDNGTSYLYRILYWYIMKLEEEYFI